MSEVSLAEVHPSLALRLRYGCPIYVVGFVYCRVMSKKCVYIFDRSGHVRKRYVILIGNKQRCCSLLYLVYEFPFSAHGLIFACSVGNKKRFVCLHILAIQFPFLSPLFSCFSIPSRAELCFLYFRWALAPSDSLFSCVVIS